MSTKKRNRNKQVRLTDDLENRINLIVLNSGISESEVIRQAIRAGLPLLESGKVNPFLPFSEEKKASPADGDAPGDAHSTGSTPLYHRHVPQSGMALISEDPASTPSSLLSVRSRK